MKRLAEGHAESSQSAAKKARTESDVGTKSKESAGSGSPVAQNSSKPKDGIVEEVRVTNFMTFTSHKFRLISSYIRYILLFFVINL